MAAELARRKYNLLLVARNEKALAEIAASLHSEYGVEVKYLVADLSVKQAAKNIYDFVVKESIPVSVLVNNAGYGLWGNFHEVNLEELNEMLRVNVVSLMELCHLFIPVLSKQKESYILNVASTTAYQAIPTLGLYAASKSLVVSFTRSLRHELAGTGIKVSCLSPGTTRTGFVERGGMMHMEKLANKVAMEPEAVARIAVKGMLGRPKSYRASAIGLPPAWCACFLK